MLLEINRFYSPRDYIENGFIRSIFSIIMYVLLRLILDNMDNHYRDFFIVQPIFGSDEILHLSLEYTLPLFGLLFFYFFIGLLTGTTINYIRD